MRLAIVGSTAFEQDHEAQIWAQSYISWVLDKYQPDVVISGGAIGIDSLAAGTAEFKGYEVIEHLPQTKNWPGYRARNILIAEDCTHLLAIRHPKSRTYGSGWTADYAERIGRKVYRKMYER
jgi:hypothetical protein